MSNSVATFTYYQNVMNSDKYNHYVIMAHSDEFGVFLSLDNVTNMHPTAFGIKRADDDEVIHVEVTKEQVAHFLSLDCPDAFIAYALALCPCPPENSDTATSSDDELDGGIFYSPTVLRCPDCRGVWVMGEYSCRHCGVKSDIPF